MRVGVDVGGTNTDAVLLDGAALVAQAKRRAVPVDIEDTTSAILGFAAGPTGYLGSLFACPYTSYLNVYGTEANAFAAIDANRLTVQRPGG